MKSLRITLLSFGAILGIIACASTDSEATTQTAVARPGRDFFELVRYGTLEEILDAIENGADVNQREASWQSTPLMRAAATNRDPAVVKALIKAGAVVDARDLSGETPLMGGATLNQNPEVCIVLLNAGADIKARDDHGKTAFIWAATYNLNPEVLLVLLKAGARIEDRDDEGKTALIWAALYNQNPETITVLLNAGADAKVRDRKGNLAIDYARDVKMLRGTSAFAYLESKSE